MSAASFDLQATLADVRARVLSLGREAWPELGATVDAALPDPLDPWVLLPIATGVAAGARMEDLERAAAAISLVELSLRIVDDCADRDNPDALACTVGPGPAMNVALALQPL